MMITSVPYEADFAALIRGYPRGSVVSHDGSEFESLRDGNMAFPGTDEEAWRRLNRKPFTR